MPENVNDLSRRQLIGWLAATGAVAAAPPLLAPRPAHAAGTVTIWLPHPTDKVRRDRAFPTMRGTRIALQAARNEQESGQIILRTASGSTPVTPTASALTGPGGATIPAANVAFYNQRYVEVKSSENGKYGPGWYPDALVPLGPGASVTAGPSLNAAIWLTVNIPATQQPGTYTGTITLSGGDTPVVVPLDLQVWNFTVPDAPSFDTACTIWYPQVGGGHNLAWGTPAYDAMMRKYYDFQTAFRLNTNDIPFRGNPGPASEGYPPGPGPDLDPAQYLDKIDEFVSDPRIRKFRAPLYATGSNETGFRVNTVKLEQLVEGLRDRGLTDRAYFYFADEPAPQHYGNVRTLFTTVENVAPDIKHLLTLTDPPAQELLDFVRAWSFVITAPKPELPGIVSALKARGDWVWWYTAYGHAWPLPSVFIHDSLVGNRLLPWIQQYLGIEGYLFWSTTVFGTIDWAAFRYKSTAGWQDRWTNPIALDKYAGDGYFLYPGTSVGIDGPVGSIRLHGLREGFEDAEYLALYERRAAQQAVTWGVSFDAKTALHSYHDLLHDGLAPYQDDPALFGEIRAQVGAEVSQLFGAAPALVHVGRPTAHHVPVVVHVPKGATLTVDGSARTPTGGTATADTFDLILDLQAGKRTVTFAVTRNGATTTFMRTIQVGAAATPHEVIVNSFEQPSDLGRITPTNVTVTASTAHATAGKSSAKLVYAANVDNAGVFFYTGYDGPGERAIGRKDWSSFDAVAMDVYNDSDKLVVIQANFYDPVHLDSGNPFYLSPHTQHSVRVPLTNLVNDLKNITSLELRAHRRSYPITLYVDNFRFERSKTGLPSPGTWARQDSVRRPTIHVVRTNGDIAMARQSGSDPSAWAFTNAGDDGLRGPVVGAVASAIDPGARLNLIASKGAGQPLQWSRETGPGGTWQRSTITPVPDNGPAPNLVGIPASALDVNGRLTWFSRTADGFLVYGVQDSPGSASWRTTYLSVGGTRVQIAGDPAVIQNLNGELTFFARTAGNQVLHGWEQSPGGHVWGSGTLLQNGTGAPALIAGRPAVTQGISGRLLFHARDDAGRIVHGWQTVPGGGPWRWDFLPLTPSGGPAVTIAGDPTNGLDPGGRAVYFARTTTGTVFHSWQRIPDGGPWDSTELPIAPAGDGAVVQDQIGRMHFFARTSTGTLRHAWQDAPGTGPWLSADLGTGIAT